MADLYDGNFYAMQRDRSKSSAETIVPLIVEAVRPESVVDIGCGMGYWPLAFQAHGVAVAHGVDGPWAAKSGVALPPEAFFEYDFEKARPPYALPLPQARYDLVTSFEFAEHVGEDLAEGLVDMFCALADAVVLGAAIPYQGGQNHVNERWPSFWADKFRARGYVVCDFIRPSVWNAGVEPWYAQNTIAYFKGEAPAAAQALAAKAWSEVSAGAFPFVHPELWTSKSENSAPAAPSILSRAVAKAKRVAAKI